MSITYDQLTSRIIDLAQETDDKIWDQAALFFYGLQVMGVKVGQLASDTGYSKVYCRELSKAHECFPSDDDRPYKEAITFSHYRICAKTSDPHGWIERAAEHQYSCRELRKAIAGEKLPDELRAAGRVLSSVKKILHEGGEAAAWLWNELQTMLDQFPSPRSISDNGEADSTESPTGSASTAASPEAVPYQ